MNAKVRICAALPDIKVSFPQGCLPAGGWGPGFKLFLTISFL